MSNEQRTLAANLLLERVEMKRDIAQLKLDLSRKAEAMIKFGNLIRSNPHAVCVDEQEMQPDYASRAQKFSSEDFDAKQIASVLAELRAKTDRLTAAEQQIRAMGYPLD